VRDDPRRLTEAERARLLDPTLVRAAAQWRRFGVGPRDALLLALDHGAPYLPPADGETSLPAPAPCASDHASPAGGVYPSPSETAVDSAYLAHVRERVLDRQRTVALLWLVVGVVVLLSVVVLVAAAERT
jgi:hypothetical protein